jgi:hypothetical protein
MDRRPTILRSMMRLAIPRSHLSTILRSKIHRPMGLHWMGLHWKGLHSTALRSMGLRWPHRHGTIRCWTILPSRTRR